MKQFFLLALCALTVGPVLAQDQDTSQATDVTVEGLVPMDATEVTLEEFLWVNRVVVVFADTDADPRFEEQIALLIAGADELLDRDVVVVTDAAPSQQTAVRTKLRPRGFQLALIGKDGGVKLRKPFPWDVRELNRVIDKMPLRREELRRQASGAGG